MSLKSERLNFEKKIKDVLGQQEKILAEREGLLYLTLRTEDVNPNNQISELGMFHLFSPHIFGYNHTFMYPIY